MWILAFFVTSAGIDAMMVAIQSDRTTFLQSAEKQNRILDPIQLRSPRKAATLGNRTTF